MDRDEFIRKLTYYPFPWHLDSHGQIRATINGVCLCPVEAIARKETPSSEWPIVGAFTASHYIKLSLSLTQQIVDAADNDGHADPDLRRQLLVACGLDRVED